MAAPAGIKYDEKMGSKMADMLQETDLLKLFNVVWVLYNGWDSEEEKLAIKILIGNS